MKVSEELQAMADELVAESTDLLRNAERKPYGELDWVALTAFRAKVQILLGMLGELAPPLCEAFDLSLLPQIRFTWLAAGAVRVLADCLREGRLATLAERAADEVLCDLLEQAEVLIRGKSMLPAAVILRAILEERLRKMVEIRALTVPAWPTIEHFKQALYQAHCINENDVQQINAMAGISNAAVQNLPEFKPEDVPTLYQMTFDFLEKFSPALPKWASRFDRETLRNEIENDLRNER
jgi:hypothetical protein